MWFFLVLGIAFRYRSEFLSDLGNSGSFVLSSRSLLCSFGVDVHDVMVAVTLGPREQPESFGGSLIVHL